MSLLNYFRRTRQALLTDEQFWAVIGRLDWNRRGDDEAVIEPAVVALADQGTDAACAFQDILAQKLYALDTKEHATNIGENAYRGTEHFSVDWFLYARCMVVANGRTVFERVLRNPAAFPKDMEFEALLTIAPNAYERVASRDFDHVSRVSYETYSNRAGWT